MFACLLILVGIPFFSNLLNGDICPLITFEFNQIHCVRQLNSLRILFLSIKKVIVNRKICVAEMKDFTVVIARHVAKDAIISAIPPHPWKDERIT
jgi:hypothetical protein